MRNSRRKPLRVVVILLMSGAFGGQLKLRRSGVGVIWIAMTNFDSISRRSFLAMAAAAPLGLAAAGSLARKRIPVGLELYSVRDELAKDLPGTVRAVAKMGYEVV